MAFTIIQRTRGGRHTLRRRTSVVHTARNKSTRSQQASTAHAHSMHAASRRADLLRTDWLHTQPTGSRCSRSSVHKLDLTGRCGDDVAVSLHVLRAEVQSSRVWRFAVGAELAVQSQQRRWDDATRHTQLQPALSSAGTDEWVLSWRSNEPSDSSGDRRAVGSRLQVLEPSFRQ